MAKIVSSAFAVIFVALIAYLCFQLWDGYKKDWVIVPTQANFYVEIQPEDEAKWRRSVRDIAGKYGVTKFDESPYELFSANGVVSIVWKYPTTNTRSASMMGILGVTKRDSVDHFVAAALAIDSLIAESKLKARVLLSRDPRLTSCVTDCTIDLPLPLDRDRLRLLARGN